MVYMFAIHPRYCGRMIGKHGRHVQYLKGMTGAVIVVHNLYQQVFCSVTGTQDQVNKALVLIRERFPIPQYSDLTLKDINDASESFECSPSMSLRLPSGVKFEVNVCCIMSTGHFFLQQPTHPTYYQLVSLTQNMSYNSYPTASTASPEPGNICSAGFHGRWYRAQVVEVLHDTEACVVKYLDYGGYATLPLSSICPLKIEHATIPFQSVECYLANLMPFNGECWSEESRIFVDTICHEVILRCFVVGYAEDGIPCVELSRDVNGATFCIGTELVNRNYAKVITISEE